MSRTKVYVCHAMTGRSGINLVVEETMTRAAATSVSGEIILLDPIRAEGVKCSSEPVVAPEGKLREYWKRDKEMIRDAHVVFDLSGGAKSEGCAHEVGYARYFLYKPVVRLYPFLGASVARLEDDYIVSSMHQGFDLILRKWGTPSKRLAWRLGLLRKLPRAVWFKMHEWLNIF